ncbi:MAG: efflux RND transporter permease subunit [Alphaproteobacteria bacterium]|nr:efflux RND transporter permease subunit [Alphaproteobacteria bacterium]
MNAIIDAALSRSRTVLAGLFLILVSGTVAYIEIPKESDPDINIPIIYVSATLTGISPEDSERLLIRPLEQELRTVEGVKEMRSNAYQGGANVILEFEAGFDVDAALDDVREKVDDAEPDLPEEAEEPTVNEVNFSLFPIILVTLSGEVPERTLRRLARELQDRLETISSVLEATIPGDREEQVEIIIDPLLVESYGLSEGEITGAVDRSNRLIAAGNLDTGHGRFAIKVPGLFEDVRQILDMPIKVNGDAAVTLQDIATARRGYEDAEGYSRLNGQNAVTLAVSKRTGENIIETIELVRAAVEDERGNWPDVIDISYSQDRSTQIRDMLRDLQNNVISAVLLVMIVVVAALGLRTATLVGIAVPGSFLAAILLLSVMGLTINIVVLFSLILAVGMLVDGAIVVTEYADRKMTEGVDRREAYGLAAKRMAWPITASTATTLAAFLPLLFWPGVVGEFMKFLPITLIATLSASLLMALIFVPTLGSIMGRPGGAVDEDTMKALAADGDADLAKVRGLTGRYLRLLDRALDHPGKILIAAALVLIGVQWAYAKFGHGIEFFPNVEPERAALQIHARGNLSIDEQDGLVREVEVVVLNLNREHGEIETIYATTGQSEGPSEDAEDIIGVIQLQFVPWDQRRPAVQILDEILSETAGIAGISVETREEEAGPPVGKAIQIEVSGRDTELLDDTVGLIRARLDEMSGLTNIEDSRPIPGIEWEIAVDRSQAAKFGADVTTIGDSIKLVTNGFEISTYRPDDSRDEIDIVVRYPEAYRTMDQLDQIRVATESGLVPISNFVTRTAQPKVGTINRIDGHRVLTVKSDVREGVLADTKLKEIQAWLETVDIDPRVDIAFKGEDEEQKEAQDFLLKAFGIALFIMAIILVTQFNSFYSAFLILTAVVMSTIGVMIGLMVIGEPFGIVMSGVGVIALAGIVVNNNIVLIDTFDRLKHGTSSARQAILRTGAQRLRPVLLTTVTTVLGLMPMVLRMNVDFATREVAIGAPSTQWWTQLSTAIVFGLSFATVLTLIVTPSALMLRTNVAEWRQDRRRRRIGRDRPATS